jgi:3,4-dihydroxy-2-butanone 4-phosphate synthase
MADTPRNARRSAAAAGRTEAAVDLATLTGVAPPGVLCEIMSDGFVPGA